MYRVIKYRHIYNSTMNDPFIVDQSDRIREARGRAKMHFMSELDMMFRHEMVADNYDIYEQDFSFTDDNMFIVFGVEEVGMSKGALLVSLRLICDNQGNYIQRVVRVKKEHHPQETEEKLAQFKQEHEAMKPLDAQAIVIEEWW